MIVVASRSQVYGPFKDGNEAVAWIQDHRRILASGDMPLVIQPLAAPDTHIKDWGAQVRQPRTVDGKPMTMAQMDAQMGYTPNRLDPTNHPD